MSENNFVKLMTVGSYAEAEQIVQELKQNGISAFRRGDLMDIYMGNSVAGEDILVLEDQIDAAKDVIKDVHPIQVSSTANGRVYSAKMRAFCWILIVVLAFFVAVTLIK